MQWFIVKFLKYIYLKINNQNFTNLHKFWHQMNGLGERRKQSPRLRKMVDKWVKTTKEEQWRHLVEKRRKVFVKRGRRWWGICLVSYLNNCDGGGNNRHKNSKKKENLMGWLFSHNYHPNLIVTTVLTGTMVFSEPLSHSFLRIAIKMCHNLSVV